MCFYSQQWNPDRLLQIISLRYQNEYQFSPHGWCLWHTSVSASDGHTFILFCLLICVQIPSHVASLELFISRGRVRCILCSGSWRLIGLPHQSYMASCIKSTLEGLEVLYLQVVPDFLAKTQNPSILDQGFEVFAVLFLSDYVAI